MRDGSTAAAVVELRQIFRHDISCAEKGVPKQGSRQGSACVRAPSIARASSSGEGPMIMAAVCAALHCVLLRSASLPGYPAKGRKPSRWDGCS